jgi:hypothetical protein
MKLREMAKVFGWKLTGVLKSCSACAKAKATTKSIPKMTTEERKASRPVEVLHLDTTGPYKRARGKNRYLVCIKDAFTSQVWSKFSEEKNSFTDKIDLILTRVSAKYLQLDNVGEWVWLKPVCAKHGITMQFTAPHTPQHNAVVEQKFQPIRNMAFAWRQASDMSDTDQMLHLAIAVDNCTIVRNLQP